MHDDQIRYPIGKYIQPEPITPQHIAQWIDEVAGFPARLHATVVSLSEVQLNTPYRQGGWTVRQVVHHLADSHLQAYVRFKLALTEERPAIKPYDQSRWAELQDSLLTPVGLSLSLLAALHGRWVVLLKTMTPRDFKRTYFHPEHQREFTLEGILGMYAWHGNHHHTQILKLKERMGW